MPTAQLTPMDIYSDMSVPFDIAAYCRGHKYCPEAVNLTRAIKARKEAEDAARIADEKMDTSRELQRDAVDAVRKRMDGDQHA